MQRTNLCTRQIKVRAEAINDIKLFSPFTIRGLKQRTGVTAVLFRGGRKHCDPAMDYVLQVHHLREKRPAPLNLPMTGQ